MKKTSLLYASVTLLSLSLVGACSKKPDQAALNASVQDYWHECTVVKATPITVQESKGNVVRFSYKVTLTKNGADVQPTECPKKNWTMLQALANEDFPKMKAGAEVAVTMERDMKTGSNTVVMRGLPF